MVRFVCAVLCLVVLLLAVITVAQQATPGIDQGDTVRADRIFPGANRVVYTVAPTATDSAIQRFTENHIVVFDRSSSPQTLLVFMPGTGGQPRGARFVLQAAADAGYRAIGLEYNDVPAAVQVCQRQRDRSCFTRFREKRIYGTTAMSEIDDLPAESIVNRLTKLLVYLDAQHPDEGWKGYLKDGKPNWERIAVSGLSQGAGMAAFIAKKEAVARVILFSSPWDYYGPNKELDRWLMSSSATPLDRWYGAYHQREHEAEMLRRAYSELRIPKDHVRVMTAEPIDTPNRGNADVYHVSMLGGFMPKDKDGHPVYWSDWMFMLGKGQ